jgi:hypothetical protein
VTPPVLSAVREATPRDAAAILECLSEAFEPFRHTYTPGAFTDTVLTPTHSSTASPR